MLAIASCTLFLLNLSEITKRTWESVLNSEWTPLYVA